MPQERAIADTVLVTDDMNWNKGYLEVLVQPDVRNLVAVYVYLTLLAVGDDGVVGDVLHELLVLHFVCRIATALPVCFPLL